MLASYLAPNLGFAAATIAACGLAVFLGHLYPLFFGFKGGKGVATALGVLFGFSTWLAFAALTVFAVVLLLWRFVSLASIAAAIGAALGATAIFGASPYTLAVVGLAVMIIWRHRANLQRLLTGTESKIAAARSVVPPSEPG
jgi:glycerol-3-phosphate acyltransferase PlsY